MVKKTMAAVLGICLAAVMLVGCSSPVQDIDPIALEKQVTQRLADSRYMDAGLELTLAGNVNGNTSQIQAYGNLKEDKTGDLPVLLVEGTVELGGMPVSTKAYLGNGRVITDIGGTREEQELSPEVLEQLRAANSVATPSDLASGTDIQKVVTVTRENNKNLLRVVVDKDQAADYLQTQVLMRILHTGMLQTNLELNFKALEIVYVLGEENALEEIRYNATITTEGWGEGATLRATVKINSLDQELTIEQPQGR